MNHALKSKFRRHLLVILALVLIAECMRGCTNSKPAPPKSDEPTFATPDAAVDALVAALRTHDQQLIQKVLGPGSEDIVSSGDVVADQQSVDRFLQSYDEKHQLEPDGDDKVVLSIGNQDWPMPIPIVKDPDKNAWVFDTDAGKDEIINRRIGRNELDVIEVCKAIGDAEREYAARDPNGDGIPEYARKFFSDPGKTNGLYWPTKEGEQPSPLGLLAASAQGEGYSIAATDTGEPRPYHGYFYRILTAQGKDAPDGARDYVVDGKLIGGFAVVAWPADYGNSGIMTFLTNYSGDVYQKDLGEQTDSIARAMTEYNPDSTWKKAE